MEDMDKNFEMSSFWGYQGTSSGHFDDLLFGNSLGTLKELIKNPMDNNMKILHLSREIYSTYIRGWFTFYMDRKYMN